jgi:hypothetical protein
LSFPAVHKAQPGWRRIIAQAVLWGIPTPAFSTALAFFDGYRSEVVPANLLQAQRDYFGAHTFKVMPGKENDRLKAGEDIRKSLRLPGVQDDSNVLDHRHQLDWPRRQRFCFQLLGLRKVARRCCVLYRGNVQI